MKYIIIIITLIIANSSMLMSQRLIVPIVVPIFPIHCQIQSIFDMTHV